MEIRSRKNFFEPLLSSPKRGLSTQNRIDSNDFIRASLDRDQTLKKQAVPSQENPSSPTFSRNVLNQRESRAQESSTYYPQYFQTDRPRSNQSQEGQCEYSRVYVWRNMIDTFKSVAQENYPLLNFLKNLDPSGVQVLGHFEKTSFREELYQCLKSQPRANVNHLMKRIEKFFSREKEKKKENTMHFEPNSKKFFDIFNDYELSDDEQSNNNSPMCYEKDLYAFVCESVDLIDFKQIIFENKLGEGAYSQVFLGSYREKKFAIKRMNETEDKRIQYSRLERELHALKRVQNVPNTVQLRGFCIRPYCCILLELVEGGSLDHVFHRNSYSVKEMISISIKLANTIQALHNLDPPLVHRDISLQNVMITRKDGSLSPVLGDFGISTSLKTQTEANPVNLVGHPRYRPPEITLKKSCGKKVDVYCFGSFLCELFSGRKVADGLSDAEVCKMRVENEEIVIPSHVHPEVASLIRLCWSHNPKQRPSFLEIIKSLEKIPTTSCPPSSAAH